LYRRTAACETALTPHRDEPGIGRYARWSPLCLTQAVGGVRCPQAGGVGQAQRIHRPITTARSTPELRTKTGCRGPSAEVDPERTMTTQSSTVLECHSLSFAYRGGAGSATVLSTVDLTLSGGERVAIVGESGSGKSTLLHLAGGLERPSGGTVRVGGRELGALSERERTLLRRQQMGIVFQAFHLIPTLTALENVALPLELSGTARGAEARDRARAQLGRVGLAGKPDRYPEQLSGGEQQRVAIARALVHQPVLILADEPTGNLDSRTGDAVFQLLLDQVEDSGAALLMVTHSEALAARLDRTLRMVDGRLLAGGEA